MPGPTRRWTQIVHNFSAGVLSPAAQDQIDSEAWLQGAARLENLDVERDGGVAGRPALSQLLAMAAHSPTPSVRRIAHAPQMRQPCGVPAAGRGADLLAVVLAANGARRHLKAGQRAAIADSLSAESGEGGVRKLKMTIVILKFPMPPLCLGYRNGRFPTAVKSALPTPICGNGSGTVR